MKLAALSAASLMSIVLVGCASNDRVDPSMRTAPPGACGEVETHVFGIYKTNGEVVEIHIDRPGKHNVVVSAHDSVKWHITASNGAEIEKVYAVGYHTQYVATDPGVTLLKDSQDDTGISACGYAATSESGCDPDRLTNLANKKLHHISSFHGCRMGTSWTVGEDLATASNCGEATSSVQYDSLAGCVAYMNGENTCGDGSGSGSGGGGGGGGEEGSSGSGSGSGSGGSGSGSGSDDGPVFR